MKRYLSNGLLGCGLLQEAGGFERVLVLVRSRIMLVLKNIEFVEASALLL